MASPECPVCGGDVFQEAAGEQRITTEIQERNEFVRARVRRRAPKTELKDLTDFMHGFPARVQACSRCGVLLRNEARVRDAGSYEDDPNDADLMRTVLPRYVQAFAKKRAAYEPMLDPCADVLEIGPHLGAFLRVAEEWNWRPTGLDVGRDTTEFVKGLGFAVKQGAIEEAFLNSARYNAVFIWNCFEQLADPEPALASVRQVLKKHGLLVIRVPNPLFYLAAQGHEALAYNNLLGWPYLYGYTPESLVRLVRRFGFSYVRGFNSELITMPFPEVTKQIAEEEQRVSREVGEWSSETTRESGTLTGPWYEMVFRKLQEPTAISSSSLPRRRIDLRFLPRAV